MAEITNAADVSTSAANSENGNSQTVCIDALRVYDSCGDKDCLSDLRVYFTDSVQSIIDTAVSVRIRDADVISVLTDLEAVPFHKGFYSVDMTYYIDVSLDVYTTAGGTSTGVNGLSVFNKKVILYGSEGSVKVFSSIYSPDDIDVQIGATRNLPRASVQVARPIVLSAKLADADGMITPPFNIPPAIIEYFGGEFATTAIRSVLVSLGVFSIVQIERNVQMLIPSYDYCIPEKECRNATDNPCDVFSRLEFPTSEFFPPNVCDASSDSACCCSKQ